MRCTDENKHKNMKKPKKAFPILSIMMVAAILTGCSKSGGQEVSRNEAEPEGMTVISLDDIVSEHEKQGLNSLKISENPIMESGLSNSPIMESALSENTEPEDIELKDIESKDIELKDIKLKDIEPKDIKPEDTESKDTEPEDTEPNKKQPPEGFELALNSPDWGLSFGESGTQPVGNAAPEDLAWYDACFMGDGNEKVIYLTFDCGYENGNTAPILDALKKHDAPAAFFVVGHFLETAPELVRRMVEEGHTVGNHTYHHPDMSSISNLNDFGKELNDVESLFYEITGTKLSPYYRPPQGKANAENIQMAQELGYYTVFWSLAYVDWDTEKQPSRSDALGKLTSRIHSGAVVLLHNTSQTNGEILDELLTRWEELGYRFAPLSELVSEL